MTEIDPDAENTKDAAEESKSFGDHMKDAAHDLKEDAKGVVRRGGDEDEEDGEKSSDSSADDADEESSGSS